MAITPHYIGVPTLHRYLNEYAGVKIGLNKVYSEVQQGNIRAAFIAGKWQVKYSELEDYPERMLQEAAGKPTVFKDLLGKKADLNG